MNAGDLNKSIILNVSHIRAQWRHCYYNLYPNMLESVCLDAVRQTERTASCHSIQTHKDMHTQTSKMFFMVTRAEAEI